MLFGLGLGLAVAGGIYYGGLRAPDGTGAAGGAARAERAPQRPQGAATSLKPTAPETTAPAAGNRFDFYEVLPQLEVVIPEVETPSRTAPVAAVQEPGRYVLQTGSFQTFAEADREKASLALLGIASQIQVVQIDAKVYHRVRIGPISDLGELNQLRRRLRESGYDILLMRVNN